MSMSVISPRIAACALTIFVAACDPTPSPSTRPTQGLPAVAAPVVVPVPMTPESLVGGIKFYEARLPPYVAAVRGLAAPESFGRWSIAKLVLVDFTGPLPEEFELEMVLGGFGPNVGAELQIIVGAEARTLKIRSDLMQMQTYLLRFSNPERANTIALLVPVPTSPQAIGKAANDPRMLGISLQSMLIRPTPPGEPERK